MRRVRSDHPFKLPATLAFADEIADLPQIHVDHPGGYGEISYRQDGDVGFLRFDFYNGAMSSQQCERLLAAYQQALQQNTRVIVLEGGDDFWSNGMHLNMIEAAANAGDESWRNINAIDDLAQAIIETGSHLTVAALRGNAGAGGVFLARACDEVWLRTDILLNPHYKDMGNLYGSEYWTYLLPRYVGEQNARLITERRLPMGAIEAVRLGLADAAFGEDRAGFDEQVMERAAMLGEPAFFDRRISARNRQRLLDEQQKPLADYRADELENMRQNFYGFDPSYHVARYNFVYKVAKSRTPVTLARHRDQRHRDQRGRGLRAGDQIDRRSERKVS